MRQASGKLSHSASSVPALSHSSAVERHSGQVRNQVTPLMRTSPEGGVARFQPQSRQ